MTYEGLGEMFESEFADMCTKKIPLVLMGGLVEGQACVDPGTRTPIGASGNFPILLPLFKNTKGVVLGFQNFEWAPRE